MKFQNKIQKNKLLEKTKLNSWQTKLQLKLNNDQIKILNHKNSVVESIWQPKKLKRHIYTQASIEKSIEKANKISQRFLTEASNRFEEDHHNTESIAQLFEHEQGQNQFRTTNIKFMNQQGKNSVTGLLEKDTCASNKPSESFKIQPSKRSSSDTFFQDASFLEDYVQGKSFKKCQNLNTQKQQEYSKIFHTVSAQENTDDTLSYQRMQIKLLENQQKKMRQHRENKQFLALIEQYKLNKEHMIRQTNKKIQSKQMLAKCRANSLKMFDKLPLINNNFPQNLAQYHDFVNPQKKIKCILAQNEGANKIMKSNSYTKLNIKQLKDNLCTQNKTLLNDVDEVQILKEQLRKKKIVISSNNLAKGYVNFQKQPIKLNQVGFPKHNLPSKPLYKKFPI